MIWAYVALFLVALELIRFGVYELFGWQFTFKILALAYTEIRLIDWNWEGGRRTTNDYDDTSDNHHRPTIFRDRGFSFEPLIFRIQFKRTLVLSRGSGKLYDNQEQRTRVHEHQRVKHGRVLPDYTPDDYKALIGEWTPELHQQEQVKKNSGLAKAKHESRKPKAKS